MADMYIRKAVLETLAIRELKKYNMGVLLNGQPCAVPIEDLIEQQYGLTVEYHYLRKGFTVLGQMVFENCYVPIYDMERREYTVVEATDGTMFIDLRLLQPKMANRLRFTKGHELGHYLVHRELFRNLGQSAAMINQVYTHDATERQADELCAAILMPKGQLKRAFYNSKTHDERAVNELAVLFGVAPKTMKIQLTQFGLI